MGGDKNATASKREYNINTDLTAFDKRTSSIIKFNFTDYKNLSSVKRFVNLESKRETGRNISKEQSKGLEILAIGKKL